MAIRKVIPNSFSYCLRKRMSDVDRLEILVQNIDAVLIPYIWFYRCLFIPFSNTDQFPLIAWAGLTPVHNVWIPELPVCANQHGFNR